jgi:isochorismate synthase
MEQTMQNASGEFFLDTTKFTHENTSLFSASDYQIFAMDCAATISTAAAKRAELNLNIQRTFNKLREQGAENPILLGALPFDNNQESCLKFYKNYLKEPKTEQPATTKIPDLAIKSNRRITSEQHFKAIVGKALQAFKQQDLQKIVLSQSLEVELQQSLNPLHLAQRLIDKNPSAYTFVVPVGNAQILVGASPELLLSRHGNKVVSNPLAGSARRSDDEQQNLKHIAHLQQSPKDNHEHRFVVDNIARNLAPYCCNLTISEQPHILRTSSMLHLSSLFNGQLRTDAPDALNLALNLHPTPAVCGTPTQKAKQFILDNEGYDRHFYTGLVGWMDAQGNGEWVVTIRCGLLSEGCMRLYAGAGIVEGSDADAEWRETESKLGTMLHVLSAE